MHCQCPTLSSANVRSPHFVLTVEATRKDKRIGVIDGIMAMLYILYFNLLKPRLPSRRRFVAQVNDFLNS